MAVLQNWQASVLAALKGKEVEEYMLFIFHDKWFSQTCQQ
jgi:hypothetical protein